MRIRLILCDALIRSAEALDRYVRNLLSASPETRTPEDHFLPCENRDPSLWIVPFDETEVPSHHCFPTLNSRILPRRREQNQTTYAEALPQRLSLKIQEEPD